MEPVKVVLRYTDGKILKGMTQNFFPNKDRFHLFPVNDPLNKPVEVNFKGMKAVFVVKDFKGNAQHVEKKTFPEGQNISGKKVEVTFTDGEVLVGSTLGYDLTRRGFFVFPADSQSNNIRVFVISSAVRKARLI